MINHRMIDAHPSYERDGFRHKQTIVDCTQKLVLHCTDVYYLHDLPPLMHYYVQVNNMSIYYDQKSDFRRVTGFLSPISDFQIVVCKYSTDIIHES
jgi:hypothetical protein